jgi:hypothetical protein
MADDDYDDDYIDESELDAIINERFNREREANRHGYQDCDFGTATD